MKFLRYTYNQETAYGVLCDNKIYSISGNLFGYHTVAKHSISLAEVTLLAPCEPTKIVAVGLNYRDHAKELKETQRQDPVLFMKPTTAILPPYGKIVRPTMSKQVDYEAELAIVIGKKACHISVEEAKEYIFGYTCFNDVTARDLQKIDGQWTRAKGFDTFAPMGPVIETELDPTSLSISLEVNGVVKQKGNTNMMMFSCEELVSYISHVMTLLPGDVITTGTPAGIGPMSAGDTVCVTIEQIGTLLNYMS
ncbi:MAG: DUF2437 domain-containing protein [Ruminococcaceae bacterium]|nr:DUF2437 domain-containing protein [Oscillospiraceae bacterium]